MAPHDIILIEGMIASAAETCGFGEYFTIVNNRDSSGMESCLPVVKLPDGRGLRMLVVIEDSKAGQHSDSEPVLPLKFASYQHLVLVAFTPGSKKMVDKIADWIVNTYLGSSHNISPFPSPEPAKDTYTSTILGAA